MNFKTLLTTCLFLSACISLRAQDDHEADSLRHQFGRKSVSSSRSTATPYADTLDTANPAVKVVALEPEDSPVLSEGRSGAHKIQGIGAGFVPDVLNTKVYDEVFKASNADAFAASKLLAKKEGILTGISSGAALHGAITLAKRPENKGKVIVALLPDSGDRYYSTPLFTEN